MSVLSFLILQQSLELGLRKVTPGNTATGPSCWQTSMSHWALQFHLINLYSRALDVCAFFPPSSYSLCAFLTLPLYLHISDLTNQLNAYCLFSILIFSPLIPLIRGRWQPSMSLVVPQVLLMEFFLCTVTKCLLSWNHWISIDKVPWNNLSCDLVMFLKKLN